MTVLSQHSYFYNVSPYALENIAIVIIHDLITIGNIRFLNGTLALTWMFFILTAPLVGYSPLFGLCS